jgi:hypothetical protein
MSTVMVSPARDVSSSRVWCTSCSLYRNHGLILVFSKMLSTLSPCAKACESAYMRMSVGLRSSSEICSLVKWPGEPLGGGWKPSRPGVAMRMAFCIASWKLRPMDMTSPTLFIDEPRPAVTRWNLFRSHRGNLTTQ